MKSEIWNCQCLEAFLTLRYVTEMLKCWNVEMLKCQLAKNVTFEINWNLNTNLTTNWQNKLEAENWQNIIDAFQWNIWHIDRAWNLRAENWCLKILGIPGDLGCLKGLGPNIKKICWSLKLAKFSETDCLECSRYVRKLTGNLSIKIAL